MKSRRPTSLSFRKQLTLAFFTAVLVVPPASLSAALPSGLQVRHGDLRLSGGGQILNIHQLTPQAIANWESFSIDGNSIVNIQQLDQNSVLLNRVMGADPSSLMGQLNANGRVYLINPNGIVVGPDASINTAEFIASALDISDSDFLNGGDLNFQGNSLQSVLNLGKITASNGDVILIAHQVKNAGEINAPEGVAGLAAGNDVLLIPEGDQRIMIKTDLSYAESEVGVDNSGVIEAAQAELKAAGGNLYELAINQAGVVRATGTEVRDGRVLLTAEDAVVAHAGYISAHNLDGSGGEVLLGGDYQGTNDAIINSARTIVTEDAVIDVSATADDADGGRVIVWADEATRFGGTIYGTAGREAGDGAFVEVSGKSFLDFRGVADLTARAGKAGTLLLDPASLTIQASGTGTATPSVGDPYEFSDDLDAGSILLVSTLESQLALSDVTLWASLDTSSTPQTDSSIVVNDAVAWTSGNTLTFESAGSIFVNADINAGAGNIEFGLGFTDRFAGVGGQFEGITIPDADLIVDSSATVTADTVTIRNSNVADYIGNSNFGPMGSIDINGILNVDTLDLQTPNDLDGRNGFGGGILHGIQIDNAANQIGRLTTSATGGEISGDVVIVDGSGGLNVDARFGNVGGDISIVTTGDLTLEAGTEIAPSEVSNVYLAAQNGSFINHAGSNAISVGEYGRFLIYSDDPANTTKGGLVGAPVYNMTYGANAPDTVTQTGNRFLYSLAPVLTLTANDLAKTIGDANPVLSYTISGLVGGDTAADVFSGLPSLSTSANASSPIGEYTIDINTGTVTLSDYNYGINLVAGTLSVEAVALTELLVTANDLFRYFGDANPEFTASFEGFKAGDDAAVVSGLQFSTTADLTSPVGNYTITPYGASATDYNISYANGTLTVNPRLLTITAHNLEKIYGDALSGFDSTVSGLASFHDLSDLGTIVYSSAASLTRADVGDYSITPSGGTNSNYAVSYVAGTASVTPRPVTITAPTLSREYGLENPTLNAVGSGFLNGEFDRSLVQYNDVSQSADVGSYALTPSGYSDSNYSVSYVDGALDVTKASLSLTPNSVSREYGLVNPAFTFSGNGYRLGQTAEDVLTDVSITSAGDIRSSVGKYAIHISASLLNTNYELELNTGQLTITKAPLVVSPNLATKVYGEANPDFTLQAYGLRNEDTVDVVNSAFFQVFANEYTGVGQYTLSLLGATAQNYNLTFGSSFLNITPRNLTITAKDAVREYGDQNPFFTADFDGLASFDDASVISNLVFTTTATQGSIAQNYGINANYYLNSNYNISFEPGTLTVTKAPLTINLSDVSRIYGDGNGNALSDVKIESAYGFKLSDWGIWY